MKVSRRNVQKPKKKNNVANLLDASEFGHLNQLKTEHKLNIKLIAQNLF